MALGMGCAGLLLLAVLQTERFGERTLELTTSRPQAVATAEAFCEQLQLELSGYRRAVWFRNQLGDDNLVHLVRKAGVARADTLAGRHTAPWQWNVRWVRPEQKEEVRVGVDGVGRVAHFEHQLPEDQAGADLSADAARALAESVVAEHFQRALTDTAQYRLLEERSEQREARTDHFFVWERLDCKVEDGEFRVEARVNGDQIGHVKLEYKAPEEFVRDLDELQSKDIVPVVVMLLLMMATLVLGGVFFFKVYRETQFRWRLPLGVGGLLTLTLAIGQLNGLHELYRGYDTSQAMLTFFGFKAVALVAGGAFVLLGVAVVVALGLALFRTRHPEEPSPGRWLGLLRPGVGSARLWLDTIVLGTALMLVGKAASAVETYAEYHWLTDYLQPGGWQPPSPDAYLPALDSISGRVVALPAVLAGLAFVMIWQRAVRSTWMLVVGLGAVTLVMESVGPAQSWGHGIVLGGIALMSVAARLFMVVRLVRYNILAYLVYLWTGNLLSGGWSMLDTAVVWYQANGAVLMVVALAPLVYLLVAYRRDRDAG